jgi:ketosteroid isomerase-like protein
MRTKYFGIIALPTVCLLALSLSAGRSPAAEAALASPAADVVSAELQQQISQVLTGCYADGEELIGIGDVDGAKAVLRQCFADDMEFEAIMPPAYAGLGFVTTNGADGFVDFSNSFYRALDIVHVQHLMANIVITKTGHGSATVNSGALAIHTFADGHTFTANVGFTSSFQRVHGAWKILHTTMDVHAITEASPWSPPGGPN